MIFVREGGKIKAYKQFIRCSPLVYSWSANGLAPCNACTHASTCGYGGKDGVDKVCNATADMVCNNVLNPHHKCGLSTPSATRYTTWSATGESPCTACTICTNGIKQNTNGCSPDAQRFVRTDTQCNPPKAKCGDPNGATWSASGVVPCTACATCGSNGVKAACTASADTQCNPPDCDPSKGGRRTAETRSLGDGGYGSTMGWSATGKAPCGKCTKESTCAYGVGTSCSATVDTMCKPSPTAGGGSSSTSGSGGSSSSTSGSGGQTGGGTSSQVKMDGAATARPATMTAVLLLVVVSVGSL